MPVISQVRDFIWTEVSGFFIKEVESEIFFASGVAKIISLFSFIAESFCEKENTGINNVNTSLTNSDRNDEVCDARNDESRTGDDLINNKFTFTKLIWIEKVKFNNLGLQL